jgi:hypothetical protein
MGAAAAEEPIVADLRTGPLAYTLRRSARAQRVRVVVDPARGVVVTVPGGPRLAIVEGRRMAAAFVAERETWIRGHLTRQADQRAALAARGLLVPGSSVLFAGREHQLVFVPAPVATRRSIVMRDTGGGQLIVRMAGRDARTAVEVLRDWAKACAREALEAAIGNHAQYLGVRPGAVSVRDQRTRWGSASRSGRLSFSWRLVLAPPEALETVVVHELAHLRVFGHGPRFWALVAQCRPDHRTWRRWLREHSVELHAMFEA